MKPQGYGSPYLKISTPHGEISEMVSRFVYKYDQKEGDSGQAEIRMIDVTTPDKPEYQENVIWTITWGYIEENEKTTRKLKIQEVKVNYSHDGMSISVLLINLADGLKNGSSKEIHSGQSAYSHIQKVAKKHGLILDFVTKAFTYLKMNTGPSDNYVRTGDRNGDIMSYDGNLAAARDNARAPLVVRHEQTNQVKADASQKVSEWANKIMPDLPQSGKSDYKLLLEILHRLPGGPYEAYGRDEKLVVRKRPLAMKPKKTYYYNQEPYTILQFSPETRNRETSNEEGANISMTHYDEETGEMVEQVHSAKDSNEPPLADQKITDPASPENRSTNPPQSKQVDGLTLQVRPFTTAHDNIYRADGYMTTAVESTAVNTLRPVVEAPSEVKKETASTNPSEAAAEAKNSQAEDEIKMNPALLRIIGEHDFKSGVVIALMGVAKKFSGKYYVLSCEHQIDVGSGYIVEANLSRNAPNSTPNSPKTNVTSDANLDPAKLIQAIEAEDQVVNTHKISIYKPSEQFQ